MHFSPNLCFSALALLGTAFACSNAANEQAGGGTTSDPSTSSPASPGPATAGAGTTTVSAGATDTSGVLAPSGGGNEPGVVQPGTTAPPTAGEVNSTPGQGSTATTATAIPGQPTSTADIPTAGTTDGVPTPSDSSSSGSTAPPGSTESPTTESTVAPGACSFVVTSALSDVISTVGIIEWSTDLAGVDGASIEFGLDTSYGMTAPVDLTQAGYRTLLLGMKASRSYHFRVVANAGDQTCASEDFTLMTGPVPNELLDFEATTPLPDQIAKGFTLTAFWSKPGGPAFIMDSDRDIVWWFDDGSADVFRARTSYDGKWIYTRNTAQNNGGVVRRVSMDGLETQQWEIDRTTHDLAVIPDGHVALIAHSEANTCDELVELDPETGETKIVFNLETAHGQTDCHSNAVAYEASDDSFIMSDWAQSAYVKISRSGELIWVMNGEFSDFTGTDWVKQHSLHMVNPNQILLFSNGGDGQPTTIFEYTIDQQARTAQEIFRYEDGPTTMFGGDVQRLPNGNTLITYGNSGELRELNPQGELIQQLSWPLGSTVNYVEWRETLYSTPHRIDDRF